MTCQCGEIREFDQGNCFRFLCACKLAQGIVKRENWTDTPEARRNLESSFRYCHDEAAKK
jgi:hypothetical protein